METFLLAVIASGIMFIVVQGLRKDYLSDKNNKIRTELQKFVGRPDIQKKVNSYLDKLYRDSRKGKK